MNKNQNKKWFSLIIALILVIVLWLIYKQQINEIIELLSVGTVEDIVGIIRGWGFWAPFISIILMVFQAFIAPIPSFLVTGANGVIFGFVGGVIISWVGAMIGALGTFYLTRIYGESFVRKFEKSNKLIAKVDEISTKHGFKIILIGRLLPFISFDFLSYAAGLSTINVWGFAIATGIGMLPGTILYVLLGSEIIKYSVYSSYIFMGVIILLLIWFVSNKLIKLKGVVKNEGK